MKISIRDGTLLAAEFPSLLDGLTALGLNSVEIAFHRDGRVTSPCTAKGQLSAAAACKKQLDCAGVSVCAVLLANDFTLPDLDAELAWIIRGAAAAKILGAPVVRLDANMKNATDWTTERRIERFTESLKKVLSAPETQGLDFGIENHGPIGNDPQFLRAVLGAVGDKRLGLTMDTGNLYWSGKPLSEVHQILEEFAPWTKHTHVKNIAYPSEKQNVPREMGWKYDQHCCALPDGDLDLARLVRALCVSGYDRTLCIENESLGRYSVEQRKDILRRDVEHLRRILAQEKPSVEAVMR